MALTIGQTTGLLQMLSQPRAPISPLNENVTGHLRARNMGAAMPSEPQRERHAQLNWEEISSSAAIS
jgi:hypothetical protein